MALVSTLQPPEFSATLDRVGTSDELRLDASHQNELPLPAHFHLQTTVVYFLVDLVWVSLVPICVKSPDVIVKVRMSVAVLCSP